MTAIVGKLDDIGAPAWIGLMVLGFVVFWPVGLGILAYLLWSGRMGCWGNRERWQERVEHKMERMRERAERWGRGGSSGPQEPPTSGNRAFDEYRIETLRRLEEEQREFRSFLDRLRHAKDKAEFDAFMAERRNPPSAPQQSAPA
jgi:Protein of unknown function (DUF2852)